MELKDIIDNVSFPVLFAVFFYYNMKNNKERETTMNSLVNETLKNNTDALNNIVNLLKVKFGE